MKHYALFFIVILLSIQSTHSKPPPLPDNKKKKPYTVDQLVVAHPRDPKTGNKVITAKNKARVPNAVANGAQSAYCSFTKTATPIVHHPTGGSLFPDDGALGGLLSAFLESLKQDTYFTVYFSKIHLLYLHELYLYLTKIYATFDLTTVNSLDEYLTQDAKNGLIRKKLIINHLITIIEAQSNQAILARFPGSLPKHLATYAGNILMKNDYGADLDIMLKDSEKTLLADPSVQQLLKPTLDDKRNVYLTLLGNYLAFFNHYTQTLSQPATSKGFIGFTVFVDHAQRIQKIVASIQEVQAINPPLFFYDVESLRALKIIPELARSLPKDVISIPWPEALVDAAIKGTRLKDKFGLESKIPIAYFTDQHNKPTHDKAAAAHLYVNIPTMQYLYVQEIIPQPAWMNSQEGILKMLRACVGDFAILFDNIFSKENILDPCLGCIIRNAATQANIPLTSPNISCKGCDAFMAGIQKGLEAVKIPSKSTDDGDSTGGIR